MRNHRRFMFTSVIVLFVAFCSLALPPGDDKPKNLKVLPKNISKEALDSIMKSFKTALGVKCSFCHDPRKDDPKKLDFVSDENEHKLIARDMMRMTDRINRKYFKKHTTIAVSCYTCHHGSEEPNTLPRPE